MSEEQRIFDGKLYCPADADLKAKKLKTHNLCTKYNTTYEDETELRDSIVREIFSELGEGCFFQGPDVDGKTFLSADAFLRPGDMVNVVISDAFAYDLYAQLV